MNPRRPRLLVSAAIAVLASAWTVVPAVAQSGCHRAISVSSSSGRPGTGVLVSGSDFYESCNGISFVALTGIRVQFAQGSRVTTLAVVDARASGQFDVQVRVPSNASAGGARFEARSSGGSVLASRAFRVTGSPAATATAGASATPEPTPEASVPVETPVVPAPVESAVPTPAPTAAPTLEPTAVPTPEPVATPVPARRTSFSWLLFALLLLGVVVLIAFALRTRRDQPAPPPVVSLAPHEGYEELESDFETTRPIAAVGTRMREQTDELFGVTPRPATAAGDFEELETLDDEEDEPTATVATQTVPVSVLDDDDDDELELEIWDEDDADADGEEVAYEEDDWVPVVVVDDHTEVVGGADTPDAAPDEASPGRRSPRRKSKD